MAEPKKSIFTFRTFVLTVGTLLAIFFMLALGPKLVIPLFTGEDAGLSGGTWQEWVMIATFMLYMVGWIVGWWRPLAGGVIMIITALVQMVPFITIDANFGSLIFGIPLLLTGILYILLARDEK